MLFRFIAAALAAWALSSPAAWAALPATAAEAEELLPLPGGAWLARDKRALRLLDPQGAERARLNLRAEHLDARPAPRGALAVLLESDTQRVLQIDVDTQAMTLASRPVLPSPPYTVETVCLYRDGQGLTHVFVVGDEGLAEQWLLRDGAPALSVRPLALPAGSRQCRVDDAAGLLYVNEPGLGIWAYSTQAEGPLERQPVALRQPFGPLDQGASAMALLPDGGLAVVEARGGSLRLLQRSADQRWTAGPRQRFSSRGEVEQLVVWRDAAGRQQIAWHDGAWRQRTLAPATRAGARATATPALPIVTPRMQTEPMSRAGDAADDPAIWVHPGDASRSRILGTNKREGLHVYDLAGRELQKLPVGRLNNVDLRQRVRLGASLRDLAVGTQRDDLSLVVFEIDADGVLSERTRVPTGLDDIYGVCLHQPKAGGLEVFVNDKDGRFLRVALAEQAGQIQGTVLQRFAVATQPEGCVADDREQRLFLGEEDRGVWAMDIAPAAGLGPRPALAMVLPVGPLLHADVEGLALYEGRSGRYLVVSSQGNHSYLVLDAAPPYRVRGAFRIGIAADAGIDGASETDGLEVTSQALGAAYPQGVLVVQDGFKRMPSGPQNFKLVDWRDIARALALPE
jgi:3-phytase